MHVLSDQPISCIPAYSLWIFISIILGNLVPILTAQICRERDITETLYYKWRDAFFERAPSVFEDQRNGSSEQSSDRVAELERMVGQLTMENAILKKASSRLDTARRKNGT